MAGERVAAIHGRDEPSAMEEGRLDLVAPKRIDLAADGAASVYTASGTPTYHWPDLSGTTTIEIQKWGGALSARYRAIAMGEDALGIWTGVPAGTFVRKSDRWGRFREGFVTCVPRDTWWVASFYRDHPMIHVYVDVIAPATFDDGEIRYVDLDLDVVKLHDGTVRVDDEEEFEERRVALGYPEDVVLRARQTAQQLVGAMLTGEEPFTTTGDAWLGRLLDAR